MANEVMKEWGCIHATLMDWGFHAIGDPTGRCTHARCKESACNYMTHCCGHNYSYIDLNSHRTSAYRVKGQSRNWDGKADLRMEEIVEQAPDQHRGLCTFRRQRVSKQQ